MAAFGEWGDGDPEFIPGIVDPSSRETVALSDNSPGKGGLRRSGRVEGLPVSILSSSTIAGEPLSDTRAINRSSRQRDRTASGNVTSSRSRRNYSLELDFPNLVPNKPYCADYLDDGLVIRNKALALKKRHIQLNGPSTFQWMPADIDQPDAYFAHEDANLPPPNVIMVNKANGRAHSAYLMATPIARHSMARVGPLRYFAAVERGIVRRLNADPHYAGLISKNPLHPDWLVEWRCEDAYTLDGLESWLFESDMRPDYTPETTFGAGRNVTVFDELRKIAYREIRQYKADGAQFETWSARCVKLALALNLQFPRALNLSEVRAIAKSVAKWTWKHFSVERFIARQRFAGKCRAAKRWQGHTATETEKPWLAEGISRATWYRRKKGGAP